MSTYALPVGEFRLKDNTSMELVEETVIHLHTSANGGGVFLEANAALSYFSLDGHYLTANVYHQCHDLLVVLVSFTDEQERTITVHYGVLPNVKTTLCLPLQALNGDKLFLERYPGVMQTVLRGNAFVERAAITRFDIATVASVAERAFTISELAVSSAVPKFSYPTVAYVDDLGQLQWKDWQGKTSSQEQLAADLQREWLESQSQRADHAWSELSQYGGWKGLRFEASGYFRTAHDGQRWWFVDPEGYALFSTGMDCIHPATLMRVAGMEHLIPQLPDQKGKFSEAWVGEGYSFGIANLVAVFGDEWRDKWKQLTEHRMKAWGINTIGNWSADDFIQASSLPYVYPMHNFPATEHAIFRDFPDVFSSEYEAGAKRFAEQLLPLKDDRRLIGYFLRNEPHWAFVDGLDLTEQMLRSPYRFESKTFFVQWLINKYATVNEWNVAWEGSFQAFEDLYEPAIAAAFIDSRAGSGAALKDFTAFNRIMIRRYVELPSQQCKSIDPHHLNLGMRYAWVSSDDVLEGCESFDVFSINCYDMAPDREQIQHISERLGKPIMIGEFHFGAADVGMLAYGIRAVATQADRGLAYQYYVEQAVSIEELIGVHYFQLNDQPVLGRFDGENYGIGVVDVCQKPYQPFIEVMKRTHQRMYEVRSGKLMPSQQRPVEIPRTGF